MATVDLERRAEIGREKRARTRAAIIETAMTMIRQRGVDDPTIDDFIEAAGIAKGTFYNHFRTKDELLQAVGAHVADRIDAAILPLFRGIKDPAQRISIAIRQFILLSREKPEWGRVLARTLPEDSGGWSADMRRGVMRDIRSGMRRGQFRVPSVQAAAVVGIGTLAMAVRTVLVERTPAQFGEAIAAMTLQAMGMAAEAAHEVATMPMPEGE